MSEVRDALIFEPLWKTNSMLTQSEIPNTGSSKNSRRRNVFGRSVESSGSNPQENGENGKDSVSTPVSYSSTKRDSVDESGPSPNHRRPKKNSDGSKPADRRSLFGAFGKVRKPPPRYSSTYVFIEIPTLTILMGPDRIDLRMRGMTECMERERRISLRLRSPGCTTSETGNRRSQNTILENSVRDKLPWIGREVQQTLCRRKRRIKYCCENGPRAGKHKSRRFLHLRPVRPVSCKVVASLSRSGLLISTAG